MNSAVLGLLAETAIHPGAGRSLGVVDLPVARETATGYPVIVGSSLKGSLREAAEERLPDRKEIDRIFGEPDKAGVMLVSDARLLLLPVRSLTSAFRWVTCPYLIERYRRDLLRAGIAPRPPAVTVEPGKALATGEGFLYLEERAFEITGSPDSHLGDAILPLVRHEEIHEWLRQRIVVLHDENFAWFCQFGLPIHARNQLEDGTKRSQNLWYEETLPPDTVMYTLLLSRDEKALAIMRQLFDNDHYFQAGGNATVGQGWFAVTVRVGGTR